MTGESSLHNQFTHQKNQNHESTIFRKSVASSALTLGFCLAAGLTVVSCQKQSLDDESLPVAQQSANPKNWKYLEFTDGFTGVGNPSKENLQIIGQALERVVVSKKEGLYRLNITRAKQANISPEVFRALNQIIENSNTSPLANLENFQMIPRIRMIGEPFPDDLSDNNCVAWCMNRIFETLGCGKSYSDAMKLIGTNGVSSAAMLSVLQGAYGADHVSAFSISGRTGMYSDSMSAVIISYMVDTSAHAVIYTGTFNGVHLAEDPQHGNVTRIVEGDSIVSVYKITK